jgi:hypothetical protein
MKRIVTSMVAVLFSLSAVAAGAGPQHEHGGQGTEAKKVTLTGEVLDLYCYMKHPDMGTGPDHAKCAKTCINKGLPIGFLADGVVYVIVGKDHESAATMVVEYAGIPSVITGTLVEHHGVKAIEIESIKAKS